MTSIHAVQSHIEKILTHLEPLLPLANCHMVDFFTNDVFGNSLNPELKNEIKRVNASQAIKNVFENDYMETPALYKYFVSSKKCNVEENPEVCMTLEQCYHKLESLGCKNINSLKLNVFMSQKKSHEVEILSSVVAALKEVGDTTHIVDMGDGKGYLSSMLALHHNIPVLGIDASPNNSTAAVERVKKLEKVWHSVYDNPTKSVPKKANSYFTPSNELYKQVTKFVDPEVDFIEIACNVFNKDIERISLAGLHTCGNLASTCINFFNENDCVKTLTNVGCCYHLLNEKFEHNSVGKMSGFPLSNYLIKKKFSIGRNARMVAAQSVNRVFYKKELPDLSIFYRALLQVVLVERCEVLPTKNVGKMRKKYGNFTEYAKMAFNKLEINPHSLCISDEDLENLYRDYLPHLDELNIFYLIRCMTSPVIESLILLDRLLFLLEQGHKHSFLVQLFNPIVSPRCYGIISIKA
ncbi:hypothetical protein HHI36_012531 [Cryptolaemus montrouzieri]|uniref:Methyltransferase domain-containing protein n=1 Tax=Cryptolaemus montrouzieri TaxID=559131 RepID=A0ABD2NF78_9CUCU